MSTSILHDVKKALGLADSYDAFDPDVIMHINSVFSDLKQLGIGPANGYSITGASEGWETYLGSDLGLNSVKTYLYLRVRLLFDPPTTSYHIQAIKEQIQQFEWRLNVHREETAWTDPEAS